LQFDGTEFGMAMLHRFGGVEQALVWKNGGRSVNVLLEVDDGLHTYDPSDLRSVAR